MESTLKTSTIMSPPPKRVVRLTTKAKATLEEWQERAGVKHTNDTGTKEITAKWAHVAKSVTSTCRNDTGDRRATVEDAPDEDDAPNDSTPTHQSPSVELMSPEDKLSKLFNTIIMVVSLHEGHSSSNERLELTCVCFF